MKRFICIVLMLVVAVSVCACGNEMQNSRDGEESSAPVSVPDRSETASEEVSEVSDESSAPFWDIALDLLPLFGRFDDPDEEDKANDFLNFIAEYYEYELEPLWSIYLYMKENGYSDEMWRELTGNSLHVWRSLYLNEAETKDNVKLISVGETDGDKKTVFTFGGDVCFADNYATMPYLERQENGLYDCFASEWFDTMQSADIAMLNCEYAISDRGEPMPGKAYTFLSKPENTRFYNELGVDFVTLANNHVFDYGEDAFYDTLSTLDEYGIDHAGAGGNAEEAQKPFYYIIDGRKIAFISATRAEKYILTPEAKEDSPGVFRCYDTERLLEVIAETKQNCDYVVLFVHWGTEYSAKLERVQKTTSHEYIDAGADLIIGSHAHQLQGIEFYNGKAIFYNLGNFWFNAKSIETGLVRFELNADGSEEFYFLPGMQEGCEVSYELGTEKGREILDHLASYEPAQVVIDDDGRVYPGN